jgi:cellulose synthase/poly-beta-1,6-N-acetylglucosamine synthase-like glycosyltransferase
VTENRLGVGFARYRGINESQYEYICFVDDDNRLDEGFTELALRVMDENPLVAACGSTGVGEFEVKQPAWFENHQRSFAVGEQEVFSGDVTWTRGILWTAGMVLRKSAIQGLLNAGFKPMVTGARGNKSLLRSEDSEMCLALRLGGWRLWYDSGLLATHRMPKGRLDWMYLRRLMRGVGYSHAYLMPYLIVTEDQQGSPDRLWWNSLKFAIWNLVKKPRKLLRSSFQVMEGDPDSLWINRSFGLMLSLVVGRKKFKAMIVDIRSASWVEHDVLKRSKADQNVAID